MSDYDGPGGYDEDPGPQPRDEAQPDGEYNGAGLEFETEEEAQAGMQAEAQGGINPNNEMRFATLDTFMTGLPEFNMSFEDRKTAFKRIQRFKGDADVSAALFKVKKSCTAGTRIDDVRTEYREFTLQQAGMGSEDGDGLQGILASLIEQYNPIPVYPDGGKSVANIAPQIWTRRPGGFWNITTVRGAKELFSWINDGTVDDLYEAWRGLNSSVVNTTVVEPGNPERPRDGVLNIWSGWGVEPVEGDVGPFLEYMNMVFSTDKRDAKGVSGALCIGRRPGSHLTALSRPSARSDPRTLWRTG